MSLPAVGDYFLYQQRAQISWPAIVVPGFLAPNHVAETRPGGFNHLILLIKEPLEFRYAYTHELQALYDLFPDSEVTNQVEGLGKAYSLIHRALESNYNALDYWAMLVPPDSATAPATSREDQGSDEYPDSDSNSDLYITNVIDRRVAGQGTDHLPLLTPSPSLPPQFQGQAQRRGGRGSIRDYYTSADRPRSTTPPANRPTVTQDDVIEGEIEASKLFVEFLVGPSQTSFVIPKEAVFSRRCFFDRHINNVRVKGEEGWQVSHPSLPRIDPDDFAFAAEYLSTGDFFRHITDDTRGDAMAACAAAWHVADQLGMFDLLEFVTEKIDQVLPWEPEEVMAFVHIVYRTSGAPLDVYGTMKDMLTDFVADSYYDLLEFPEFVRRVRGMPELERDVHRKVALRAELRIEAEEENAWMMSMRTS